MPSELSWLRDYANVIRFKYNNETFVLERAGRLHEILPTTTVHHVLGIARKGKIPHYRIGNRLWFDVRDVFDSARVVPPGREQPWPSWIEYEKMMPAGQKISIAIELIRLGDDSMPMDADFVQFHYDDDTYSLEMADRITGWILGTSDVYIRRLAHERVIPHFRIGERVYFDREDIVKYIKYPSIQVTRVPGEKKMAIAEKIKTEVEIIRFNGEGRLTD